jgi:hypothetical protein
MQGDIIYCVYGVHGGREEDVYFGTYRTRPEAEQQIAELHTREMHGANWAARHHDRGFVIREVVVDTTFEPPPHPKPRERYVVRTSPQTSPTGGWASTRVEVLRRSEGAGEPQKLCEYMRNHAMYQTFEPFRQGGRELALISRDYTRTAVLDLRSGEVIAEEEDTPYEDGTTGAGFCPVGFYVPDWWDVHDASVIPGSRFWTPEREQPSGDFGFVWGCIWGDDGSWKIQHLDLSRVQQGIIHREERFGYVELDCRQYVSPVFTPTLAEPTRPPFIQLSQSGGKWKAVFSVEMQFELATGEARDWRRHRIDNLE